MFWIRQEKGRQKLQYCTIRENNSTILTKHTQCFSSVWINKDQILQGNSVWLTSWFWFLPIVSHTGVPQAQQFINHRLQTRASLWHQSLAGSAEPWVITWDVAQRKDTALVNGSNGPLIPHSTRNKVNSDPS